MDDTSTLQEDIVQELIETDEKISDKIKQIELAEAIERLHESDDFKLVVLDGYMTVEAERIFALLTTPMGWKRELNENLMDKMGSIRDLKEYIGIKLREAVMAPEELEELKDYRKSVTAKGSQEFGTEE